MKIGIFDSGLGGLFVAKGIMDLLPEYDYIYLGDTEHLPYGTRSQAEIYDLTCRALEFLFEQNCSLVILACNTASSQALRKIQKEFLPKDYPGRRVLGMIVPSVENAAKTSRRVGVLATPATVHSKTFIRQFLLFNRKIKVFQNSAPLLVPLVEYDGLRWAAPILRSYLKPLLAKKIDTLILGCTHYAILKKLVQRIVGPKVRVVSQADIIPQKLKRYLERHPEIKSPLSRRHAQQFLVTSLTANFEKTARQWLGRKVALKQITY